MLKKTVPSRVHELLEREHLNGVPVLLSTTSDLTVPGDLRSQWVIANRDHLAVVSDDAAEGAAPRVEMHLPISRVEKFRAHATVGSGFLQAYVDNAWVDVARYSNRLSSDFQKFADRLEELRENGTVEMPADEVAGAEHCPKCNLRLPGAEKPVRAACREKRSLPAW